VTVRAQYWAVRIPGAAEPFDTAQLKVYYPAGEPDPFTGIASAAEGPHPVVVLAPGINVHPEAYRWLAERLAGAGFVVATYAWVGELFPGQYGVTPGAALSRLTPEGWGTGPTSDAIGPVLEGLARLHAGPGPLTGALALDRVVLGGHSGGGAVALQNATPRYFPSVVAGFSYGAHAGLAVQLGWPPASIVAPAGGVPFLFLAGTRDGVISASAARYGVEAWDPVRRTIDEALAPGSVYALLDGANHFAMGWPEDPTTARGFLDETPTTPPEKTREALGDVITLFCRAHTVGGAEAELAAWLAAPPAAVLEAGRVASSEAHRSQAQR
jgi:dienelactone hydrolase